MIPKRRKASDIIAAARSRPAEFTGGRPRERMLDLPIYDSMAVCHAHTGIPIAVLRTAKAHGCPAFVHARIVLSDLLKWLFSKAALSKGSGADDDSVDWNRRDKKMSALIKEVTLEERRGAVIEAASVKQFVHALVDGVFFGEIERMSQEYPATLKGKSELEIADECGRQATRARTALEQKLSELEQLAKKKDDT